MYELIPARRWIKAGQCPVSFYHLVFKEKKQMVEFGAIVPYGDRWLVNPPRFHGYLRHRTKVR
ncbi:MAG: hypothetical protein ACREV4_02400 [Gammaproteobacteria bacterium]